VSIVLETCSACNGTGWEVFSFSDTPFHGGRLSCWSCSGEGKVAVMQSVTELADDIFRAREERAHG
jgi:DnaJ-class molecular chaperone